MKKILFALLMCGLCFSCVPDEDETHHYRIKFVNNSDKDVYVTHDPKYYPRDTLDRVISVLRTPLDREQHLVRSHDISFEALNIQIYWWDDPYEIVINRYKNKKLEVYVLDAEYFNKENYYEDYKTNGYKNKEIVQRIDLTLEDLQRSGWTITYP